MVIGFFTDTYFPDLNGVATSVENFAKELRKEGHTVYIFAPKIKGKYKDEDEFLFRIPSVKILAKVEPEIYSPAFWPNECFKKMFTTKFDIIQAHGNGPYSALGLLVARVKRIPFVMTFHTIHTLYTHYIFNGKIITPKMVEIALKTFAQRCDIVLTPSEKMKAELRKYGVKKEIEVVPNFLDFERFSRREEGFLHKLLKLEPDTPLILTVGRIGIEKRYDLLIRAMKLVFAKNDKAHFVIVGHGPEQSNLQKLAKDLGIEKRVHFTGPIKYHHIPFVYHDSQIFVFASVTETQGVCILEAAAAGLPVVINDDPAFVRMVINNDNGFVLPLDEAEYAEKILMLLEDGELREKLSKNSRKVAFRNFNGLEIIQHLLAIYQKAIKLKQA